MRTSSPLRPVTLALLTAGALLAACSEPEPAEQAPAAPAAEADAVPGADPAYVEEIEAWRADRIASLTAEDGWLTLAGLHWLDEGSQTIGSAEGSGVPLPDSAPAELGTLEKTGTAVLLRLAPGVDVTVTPEDAAQALPDDTGRTRSLVLVNDLDGEPTTVTVGDVSFHVIRRGDDLGVRVRDRAHPERQGFDGIDSYPVDPAWNKPARFEPYEPPRQIPVANVLGMLEPSPSPGAVVFEHEGESYRLDTLDAGPELFVIFADETNGRETYGAGRYLYAQKAGSDGTTRLDFNKAYNPPCTFTEFATCPLPPPQNKLPVAITAGEKDWRPGGAAHD